MVAGWSLSASMGLVMRMLIAVLAGLLLLAHAPAVMPAHGDEHADESDAASLDPVVFIHGFLGSASQFESHAMRFTSNGVAQERLFAFEYDTAGSTGESDEERTERLDAFVDDVLAATGATTVTLVGHSRGTGVAHDYLDDPQRAAKVGALVNLDGRSAEALPGGVRTLAVWAGPRGGGDVDEREIVGATDLRLTGQTHTQVATSAETFAAMYEFLTGSAPATTDVLREGTVTIAGRAVLIGDNRGPSDAGLQVWPLDPSTGQRSAAEPTHQLDLPADGSFGPLAVDAGAHYELTVLQERGEHRHYLEPFERSNHFVRLLVSEPGLQFEPLLPSDPDAVALTIQRNREWWADQEEAARNDVLRINGVNIARPALFPREDWNIGMFVYDDGADGESNLDGPIPLFGLLPFITGIDLALPASADGSGSVEVAVTPRESDGRTIVLNVPDLPSDTYRISIQFKDYLEVAGEPEDEPAPFVDVAADSVHAAAIRALQLREVIRGVDDERFAPGASIRRDQAASMLARLLDLEPLAEGPFDDIDGNVHAGAINALADAGLAQGSGGAFRPAETITRAQVASLLGRALGLEEVADGPFTDVDPGSVHAGFINALAAQDIVRGIDETTFAPAGAVRRDQFASMLYRTLLLLEGIPAEVAGVGVTGH